MFAYVIRSGARSISRKGGLLMDQAARPHLMFGLSSANSLLCPPSVRRDLGADEQLCAAGCGHQFVLRRRDSSWTIGQRWRSIQFISVATAQSAQPTEVAADANHNELCIELQSIVRPFARSRSYSCSGKHPIIEGLWRPLGGTSNNNTTEQTQTNEWCGSD